MKSLAMNTPFLSLAAMCLLAALCCDKGQPWLFWAGATGGLLCLMLYFLVCAVELMMESELEKGMRSLEQARRDTFKEMLRATSKELDEVESILKERVVVVRKAAESQKQLATYRGDWQNDASALEAAADELEGVLTELREIRLAKETKHGTE